MKTLAYSCAVAFGMLMGGIASAVPIILVLDNTGVPSFQQTDSSPCVIGGPSCNNPAGFGFRNINGADNDGTVDFTESTQSYLVSDVIGVLGSTFNIGIDTNQAGNQNDVNNWVQLQTFEVLINNVVQFQYNVPTPGTSINLHNGNGYSDAFLALVDLSSFNGSDTVTFRALYNNTTDGAESFFLFNANAPPCTSNCGEQIPEPGTLLLLGSALAALGGFARRKAKARFQA
jgi:hypothetical protein